MNKEYQVIFSDKAAEMIINHVKFLANVSQSAAQNLRMEIMTGAESLKTMPESYPRLISPEIPANKYRKKLVAKRYLLIYQIKDNTVYIDYVADCRRDYGWLC